MVRRDNLKRSADELKGQIEEARGLYDAALEDLRKAETMETRDKADQRFAEPPRGDADPFAMGRLAARA